MGLTFFGGSGLNLGGRRSPLKILSVGIAYLFRDLFSTDRAAGAVDGTSPEPGGAVAYTRECTDTESKITIADDWLVFASGKTVSAFNDPCAWYEPGLARVCGRCVEFQFKAPSAAGIINMMISTDKTNTSNQSGIQLATGVFNLALFNSGASGDTYSDLVTYTVRLTMRTAGVWIEILGGAEYPTWTLIGVSNHVSATPLYLVFNDYSKQNASIGRVQPFDRGGNYASNFGIATSYIASPSAGAEAIQTADGIEEMTWTPATNDVLDFDVRRVDADNRWIIRCDQAAGAIKLFKREAGIETEYSTGKTQTWTAGTAYRLYVRTVGATIRSFVDGVAKNVYTSATFQQTATGVKTSLAGANLACWPRNPT